MRWMILPYLRYFDFSGRSRRLEYWMFALFYTLVCVGFGIFIVAGLVSMERDGTPGAAIWIGGVGLALFLLVSFIPAIAVAVRRFHDQGQSGWLYLLSFIPYIGWLVLIVFMCIDGTDGTNRFGDDPKGRGLTGVFA